MVINGVDIGLDTVIRFRTKNNRELYEIYGVVKGLTDVEGARLFADVNRYHQEVRESNPNDNLPLTPDSYKFIRVTTEQGIDRIFAPEWIREETLSKVDEVNVLTFNVYGVPESERITIYNLLRDNGYVIS